MSTFEELSIGDVVKINDWFQKSVSIARILKKETRQVERFLIDYVTIQDVNTTQTREVSLSGSAHVVKNYGKKPFNLFPATQ